MDKPTVLLADDDAVLRRLVGATLGTQAFHLLYARDGEEALRLAREQLPQVILLDINMPKVNGLEVCRRLKAEVQTAAIKVILLTGSHAESDHREGRVVGADGYFVKPFSPFALLRTVRDLLAEQRPATLNP